jgi:hypothetical protein
MHSFNLYPYSNDQQEKIPPPMKRGRKRRKYSRPIVMSATLMDPVGEGGGFVKTYIYHFVTKTLA